MPLNNAVHRILANGSSLSYESYPGVSRNEIRTASQIARLIERSTLDEESKVKIADFKKSRSLSDRQWREICLILYRQKLLECLEDHRLTEDEERYMDDLVLAFQLSDEEAKRVRIQMADMAMKQLAREVLEDQVLTEEEKKDFFRLGRFLDFPDEQIRDYLTGESLRYFTDFWDTSSSKKVLDSSKQGQLLEFQRNLKINVESRQPTERDYAKLKLLWMIKNGLMPRTPQGIFVEYDEVCHWSQKSILYEEEKIKEVSHSGSTQGVPIAIGSVYIIGSSKKYNFDHSRFHSIGEGEFAVTSHRVLHRIQDKSLDIPFKNFVQVRIFQQGIEIQREGNLRKQFFELEDVDLAASVLSGALQRKHA